MVWISSWLFLYIISILFLVFGIQRLRAERQQRRALSIDQVSVVIPFRNEGKNIGNFLKCVWSQKYQPVQWIFVNDHSTDDFIAHFEDLSRFPFPVRLLHLPPDQTGKKRALRFGMDHVRTDYCLTMDADVTFGADYIKSLLGVPAADLVILPVRMTAQKWWQHFFTTEYSITSLLNLGIAGWSRPVNASGANLLINLDEFEKTDDIENHEQFLSGDDVYTLRAFRENEKSIALIENPLLTVETATPNSIPEVMEQRVRWLSKTGNVGDSLNNFLGAWAVFLHLSYFLFIIMSLAADVTFMVPIIVGLKFLADLILLRTAVKPTAADIGGLLLFELFYPIYIFGLLFTGIFSQPEWKERKVVR